MKQVIKVNSDYISLLKEIKQKVRNAQIKASVRVNSELILMYWDLGEAIVKKQAKTNWGDGLISQLSKDLLAEFPEMKGFSETNLKYIRLWYSFYTNPKFSPQLVDFISNKLEPIHFPKISPQLVDELQLLKNQILESELLLNTKSPQVVADYFSGFLPKLLSFVPWGHHREIITKCKDIESALFYVLKTIENSWSRSVLVHQMELKLYERKGKSLNNFDLVLPKPDSDLARELLKNPYSFEFLNLSKEAKEKDLQNALLDNIKKFLIELGYGFAFLGKEKLLTVGGDDFYVDLVFYHTKLHCYFIVELKIDDFKPEYSGKLNFYLNAFNAEVKSHDDKPTIGLLLCKKANKLVAEYSLKNINNPIGISEYRLMYELPEDVRRELPSIEEIERELEGEIQLA
ncbi:MAG: PDDEXK nuclease domain-containing protein [FCB group bacterium]|jgi:predicted nuclease of restriction endonuclease-like (RecB) superfamily